MTEKKAARVSEKSSVEGIVVSSQQSRFHADAIDAPRSKDVDVKDLTISVGGFQVLDHAHLKIQNGVHYVFHGRNGTGKSTVLKALADRLIPGVPSNLRVLLLGQTRISSDIDDEQRKSQSAKTTVLEHVTSSDLKREKALQELSSMSHLSLNRSVTNNGGTVTGVQCQLWSSGLRSHHR